MTIRVENRDELLDIKAGNQSYESAMQKAENLVQSIENHYSATTLPDFPDLDKTTKILIQTREKLYHHE